MGLLIKDIRRIILQEYKKLGGGIWGKVFKKVEDGKEYAYKITSDHDEFDIAEEIFFKNDKLKVLPKLYYVKYNKDGSYFFIKRDFFNLPNEDEISNITKYSEELGNYVNDGNKKSLEFVKISNLFDNKFINFILQLRKDYLILNMPNHRLDIHGNNIGIDKNGNYVLFDF
jgi:hypothetical protein